jgi:hypothetical protein
LKRREVRTKANGSVICAVGSRPPAEMATRGSGPRFCRYSRCLWQLVGEL